MLLFGVTLQPLLGRADETGTISTAAGNGHYGYSGDGGSANQASIARALGVAVADNGSIYVADTENNRIRRVDASGVITTVAGSGQAGYSGDGGPATLAALNHPYDLTIDSSGNLYVVDSYNHRIRRVDWLTGAITSVAGNGTSGFGGDGGPAVSASLNRPTAVTLGPDGGLYLVDSLNDRIRRLDLASGLITTVAGSGAHGFSGDEGPATQAALAYPFGVAIDSDGNLYFSDLHNHRIRRVDVEGMITTYAGNGLEGYAGDGGPATEAILDKPSGIDVDDEGSVFIADAANTRVRRVDRTTNVITTVAGDGSMMGGIVAYTGFYGLLTPEQSASFVGDGGPASEAALTFPMDVAIGRDGSLIIADGFGHRIRRVSGPI